MLSEWNSAEPYWPGWDANFWQSPKKPHLHSTAQIARWPYTGSNINCVDAQTDPKNSIEWLREYRDLEQKPQPPIPNWMSPKSLYTDFSAPVSPSELELGYSFSSLQAEVDWTPLLTKGWTEVDIKGHTNSIKQYDCSKALIRMKLLPGTWYEVTVRMFTQGKALVAQGFCKFKSILNHFEMAELCRNALFYIVKDSAALMSIRNTDDMHSFAMFYRDKPSAYWMQINQCEGGIMRTYLKDNNGQPGNPINGEVKGLFFNGRIKKGRKHYISVFGDTRFSIAAHLLLNDNSRLYFCDFYCNNVEHYATVVLTRRGSVSDKFCEKHLLELDVRSNKLIFIEHNPLLASGVRYWISDRIWVEVFYTEHVDLQLGSMSSCAIVGKGQSKPGGLVNNRFCTICNLYPKTMPQTAPPEMALAPKAVDAGANEMSLKRKLEDVDGDRSGKRVKGNGDDGAVAGNSVDCVVDLPVDSNNHQPSTDAVCFLSREVDLCGRGVELKVDFSQPTADNDSFTTAAEEKGAAVKAELTDSGFAYLQFDVSRDCTADAVGQDASGRHQPTPTSTVAAAELDDEQPAVVTSDSGFACKEADSSIDDEETLLKAALQSIGRKRSLSATSRLTST